MRTEKEIREELKNRENMTANLHFLYQQSGNEEFEGRSIECEIMVSILKWVLKESEMIEETLILDTKTGDLIKD